MNPPKIVHVAVGVIRRGGQVLIAKRPDHVHQGGLLEFPGGKVEPGETVQQALVREMAEETGLRLAVDGMNPLIGIGHDYGDKHVFLDVWEADAPDGEPEGREGQQVEWRWPEDLTDEEFPAANRPIIRAIRLPHEYAITGQAGGPEGYIASLRSSLPGLQGAMCLLRAPELDEADYLRVAAEALPICQQARIPLMLHGAPSLLKEIPEASGVHLPAREASRYSARPIGKDHWLAVSCHNREELIHAQRLNADFVVLGPVKPTQSHPDAEPMGMESFRELVSQSPLVVYGLGGLVPGDQAKLRKAGAQGIAGIGYWWKESMENKHE